MASARCCAQFFTGPGIVFPPGVGLPIEYGGGVRMRKNGEKKGCEKKSVCLCVRIVRVCVCV